ncbi:unnamed protein product [Didymodactylos carnosus]|uniref:Uroporphyrinogen decarboxylase n=1 Tax=Didymodactylos carnosus TaxID=1234261 RepID=A0A813TDQ4_9BILA|nr:unnamed protein product [Didymodactylos carnosus]CAF0810145.1 unnamed protein product [Didymodactylos carnosus]CAF3532266.1 unnamed protein product [Didymodactylos carnosus]CAF3595751.1 unnamed protein product [Didymodactylos carnosus]
MHLAAKMTLHEFPPLKNNRILRACRGESIDCVPVWIMRQAGRYLPEFKKLLTEHGFFKLIQSPDYVKEITLQPVKRFDLDAAILFTDIVVLVQAMGFEMEMSPKDGPCLKEPLTEPDDVLKLLEKQYNIKTSLSYVYESIVKTRHELDGQCPLIGFSGGPLTLMCFIIEGKGTTAAKMSKLKRWLYCHRERSHQLLKLITELTIEYLKEQILNGIQLIQIFESYCQALNEELFLEYVYPYLKQIRNEINNEQIPLGLFAKDAHYAMELIRDLKYDIVSLDWTIQPSNARHIFNSDDEKTVLQGNLDPCVLYSIDKNQIELYVRQMLEEFGTKQYIANLGHGIYPDVPVDNVKIFVDAVHRISKEMIDKEKNS